MRSSTWPSSSIRSTTRRRCTTSTSTARRTCSTPPPAPESSICWSPPAPPPTAPSGQSRAAHRGASGPGHAELRVRARQDRDRPHLPALGGKHPKRTMTILRPASCSAPTSTTTSSASGSTQPFIPLIDGRRQDFQYVHEDDVVDAMSRMLLERQGGIFNLTGDGTVKLSEAAAMRAQDAQIPLKLYRRMASALWRLRSVRRGAAGPARLLAHPWIARTRSRRAELGWQPRTRAARRSRSRCVRRGSPDRPPTAAEGESVPAPPEATPVA